MSDLPDVRTAIAAHLARARQRVGAWATSVRFATGGTVPAAKQDDDCIPAFLSPGRSTTIRPGETILEATERLTRGDDL